MESNKSISRRKFLSNVNGPIPAMMTAPRSVVESTDNPSKHTKKSGMKVGLDTGEYGGYEGQQEPIMKALDHAKELGFDGLSYRSMLSFSSTLDIKKIKEIKAHADSLGLYLEGGISWVNPYNTSERRGAVNARAMGNGDYKLAMERMILAASEIGCKELYAVSGNSTHGDPTFSAPPRFRTDVSWRDQLLAMKKFILMLKPILKGVGCRLNLENHGDTTSFEFLELIDEVGEDILGITLDTGNLPLTAEVPMDEFKRLAPYVHMMQPRDGILYKTKRGIGLQTRPPGQGIIDWKETLVTLGKYFPDLHLSIEYFRTEYVFPFHDPEWRLHFPDLTNKDLAEIERLVKVYEDKMKNGERMGVEEFNKSPNDPKAKEKIAAYLRKIINENNL